MQKAAKQSRGFATSEQEFIGVMKRIGNIFERIVEYDNLRLAFWKASRGKLARAFKGVSMAEDLNLDEWSVKLDMYSGSDVVGLAKKACQIAFRRSIDENAAPIVTSGDLEQARRVIPTSITPAILKQFEEFNEKRFG